MSIATPVEFSLLSDSSLHHALAMIAALDVVWLSRLQFALTIMFHYLFPPKTIGTGVVLVYLGFRFIMTGDVLFRDAQKFWTKIYAVNFALGVATGIVMEFQFGTILGAGIYVLIGKVAGAAGPLALWSYVLAAALAGITAISYSALAPAFPEAAGEAAYVREAFGRRWLTIGVGLLLALTGIVSAGVLPPCCRYPLRTC